MTIETRGGWCFSTPEVMTMLLIVSAVMWGIAIEQFNTTGVPPFVGAFQEGIIAGILFLIFGLGAPFSFIYLLLHYKKIRRDEKIEMLKFQLEENQRQQLECLPRLAKEKEELESELKSF
jgi:hypothetical protein